MRLTTKSEYGILCLLNLAKTPNSDPVSLGKISTQEGIQKDYVEKIMLALQRSGIVKALRGLRGGFVLTRVPEEIRMLDVIVALEGKTFESFCDSGARGKNPCQYSGVNCGVRPLWARIRAAVDKVLEEVTLKDLLTY